MVSDSIKNLNFEILNPLFIKVGIANLIITVSTLIITAMISSAFMFLSIAAGTIIGMVNLSILVRTVRNGCLFDPDKAQRFVMKRYYIRLISTTLIIGLLVSRNFVSPAGLILGFSLTMITTLFIAMYFSKYVLSDIKQVKEAV